MNKLTKTVLRTWVLLLAMWGMTHEAQANNPCSNECQAYNVLGCQDCRDHKSYKALNWDAGERPGPGAKNWTCTPQALVPISGTDGSGEYPICLDCTPVRVNQTSADPAGVCQRDTVTAHFVRYNCLSLCKRDAFNNVPGDHMDQYRGNTRVCVDKWTTDGGSTEKCGNNKYYTP